jgi:acid phosphatase
MFIAGLAAFQLRTVSVGASTNLTVLADQEASVSSAQPDQNSGPGRWVGMDASPVTYGFYQFGVTIPDGMAVTGATFRCWAGSSSAAGTSLWSTTSNWDENTITWDNAPMPDLSQPPIGETGPVTGGDYASADVTSAVTESGSYSFVGVTSSNIRWSCAGRDGSHRAELAISMVPSDSSSPPTSSSPPVTSSAPETSSAPVTSSAPATSSVPATSSAPDTSSAPPTSSAPATSSAPPSSPAPPPSSGQKVLLIIGENHSDQEAIAQMPHLASWANKYGQATNYSAIRHPSLPNYLAIFGGSTYGTTSDCGVGTSGCVATGQSVFGQTLAAGKTAKAYQESMSSNCKTGGSGGYAPRHGPWPYWTGSAERSGCLANDVSSGTPSSGNLASDIDAGALPVTGELTPNLCNDAHDCSLATFDNWLGGWIPTLMAGPDYQAGRLTIIVTFDEDDGSQSNRVPFVVIDPALHAKTVTGSFNHYSMTKWFDDNAGVAELNNAASASNLKAAFGL